MNSFLINNTSENKRTKSKGVSYPSPEHARTDVEAQIETTKRVLQLVDDSGLSITQVNGQRKLGPPPNWIGTPPSPECEVFVGKLPRDLYESEIYPIFRRIGEIYEIRLMMDFSGTNRGYCFVMYTNTRDAERAIRELNNYEIRSGRKIGVLASINNCRLCVTHLPMELNTEAFIKKIFETTSGVTKVAVYRLTDNRPKNALIFYNTHIDAAMARRRLVPDRSNFIVGAEITIDWAHPNLYPDNVVEECGILDKNGRVEMWKRFVEVGRKNSLRDGKFSKENIIPSHSNGTKSDLSSMTKMNKKKMVNTRKKSLNSSCRLNNPINDQQQQQLGINVNQRIMENNFYPCKNHKIEDILKTRDMNGNLNDYYRFSNKIPKVFDENYQSSELKSWMPLTINAPRENQVNVPHIVCNNYSHMSNNFYKITHDCSGSSPMPMLLSAQINLQGNHLTSEMCGNGHEFECSKIDAEPNQRSFVQMSDNNAVRLVMQNIQPNWIVNRENFEQNSRFEELDSSVIHNQALDINSYVQNCPVPTLINQENPEIMNPIVQDIPHNVQQMEYDPLWEKRIVSLTDFYDYRQPRPILNRFS